MTRRLGPAGGHMEACASATGPMLACLVASQQARSSRCCLDAHLRQEGGVVCRSRQTERGPAESAGWVGRWLATNHLEHPDGRGVVHDYNCGFYKGGNLPTRREERKRW